MQWCNRVQALVECKESYGLPMVERKESFGTGVNTMTSRTSDRPRRSQTVDNTQEVIIVTVAIPGLMPKGTEECYPITCCIPLMTGTPSFSSGIGASSSRT